MKVNESLVLIQALQIGLLKAMEKADLKLPPQTQEIFVEELWDAINIYFQFERFGDDRQQD